MAKKVSSAKFCENVAQMLEEVKGCGEAVTITERSHPVAVLISFESFKALQERLRDLEEAQLWQIVAQGRKRAPTRLHAPHQVSTRTALMKRFVKAS
jgi:prevent-host-death family protein